MKHEAVDISTQVHELYSLMDPVALETLVIEVRICFVETAGPVFKSRLNCYH